MHWKKRPSQPGRVARWAGVMVILLLGAATLRAADSDPKFAERQMTVQLEALRAGDYQQFIAGGNRAFEMFMDESTFDVLQMQHSGELAAGYRLEYLGMIERVGMLEHLWRVHLSDDEKQLLGHLTLAHGQVVGFDLD